MRRTQICRDDVCGTIRILHRSPQLESCGHLKVYSNHLPMWSDIIRSGGGPLFFFSSSSSSHHHLSLYPKHTNIGCRFPQSSHWLIWVPIVYVCVHFTATLCPEREPIRISLCVCVWAPCHKLESRAGISQTVLRKWLSCEYEGAKQRHAGKICVCVCVCVLILLIVQSCKVTIVLSSFSPTSC